MNLCITHCKHCLLKVFGLFVCLCSTYVQCLWEPEEGARYPGTGLTDGCERPCESWESNFALMQEQPLFLSAEPTLQPLS